MARGSKLFCSHNGYDYDAVVDWAIQGDQGQGRSIGSDGDILTQFQAQRAGVLVKKSAFCPKDEVIVRPGRHERQGRSTIAAIQNDSGFSEL